MGLFSHSNDPPFPWPEDGPDMPPLGRLCFNPLVQWWPSCRWCHGSTYLRDYYRVCGRCDAPDVEGKSPFEIVKGSE